MWIKFTHILTRHRWELFDQVSKLPLTEYFNMLAFEIGERKEMEERLHRAAQDSKKSPAPYVIAIMHEILRKL